MMDITDVIIDNGSGVCKSGLVGDSLPTSAIPSIVVTLKVKGNTREACHTEFYFGKKALTKRGTGCSKYPIERGIVTSWDLLEKLWKHVYTSELHVKSKDRPVLITAAPLTSFFNREKMSEIMFECFNVPAMYVAIPATLALYASGRTRGIVLDSGYGLTDAVPIYEGYYLPDAVKRLKLAGNDITENMKRLLLESGHNIPNTIQKETFENIKETLCYIALDPQLESKSQPDDSQQEYTLPDGNLITIQKELFKAPELLFTTSTVGLQDPGIHKLIYDSILKCDRSLRKDLFSNILLSGGSTLFLGLEERLLKEIKFQVPSGLPIKVIAPSNRNNSVWIGASILTSLTAFKDMWVTSNDYRDYGPSIVNRRCF
ncbi:actin-3-like [Scyliorhinus canicula]|uniref:actin-3-like n=1 Tax=Scyliorhinus canicula TaxID=7830 RepID=UPI0018F6ACEE|nr:actin-3-like [Scyliorhinus canicula]